MSFSYSRIIRLYFLFLFIGMLLLARLFYLQYVEGPQLALKSLNGRIEEMTVEEGRGDILDCNGILLTNCSYGYTVAVFPSQIFDIELTAARLALLSGGDAAGIAAEIKKHTHPFKLLLCIAASEAEKINEEKLPGVLAVPERIRYGNDYLARHVIGYINDADKKGVSGIERMFEETLHGNKPFFLAAMVDAGQQIIPGLGYKRLNPNYEQERGNVVLTINSKAQKICEEVMDQTINRGAVVIMRPATGEILAMASRPNFVADNISVYLQDKASPLLNRAVSAYQPGSVFKLLVAAAALEEQIVKPDELFYDPGYIDIDKLRFKGWDYEKGGHGTINFKEALAYSSNPVFIEIGQRLGPSRLINYARRLGFGEKTKLGLDGETGGNLPESQNIYAGDLANLSIGQGSLEASPLQIAKLVAVMANDGIEVEPYIVAKLTDNTGKTIKIYSVPTGKRVLSSSTAAKMRGMMTATTSSGTGREAYVENGGSAGKTGTAETGRYTAQGKSINHAWFAGYAPLENPQVVVVVFVEDGMSGGDVAAPIFRSIVTKLIANGIVSTK